MNAISRRLYFVSTPIFYVNAAPHIGHLYTALIADAVHRFNKLRGSEVTILSTGTDEHGTKIQEAAKKKEVSLKEYCDGMSSQFKSVFERYNISFTHFIRTTDNHHKKAVHHFWDILKENGYIYNGKYSGWYCTPEEAFLSSKQLTEKTEPNGRVYKVSAESGHPVEWTEEENFVFRLSSLQNDLLHWLQDSTVVQPRKFHKQLLSWVQDEALLQDLSISRCSQRVHWGIPVPRHPEQTIYVWLEALVNYLSVVGYPNERFKQHWPPDVQVIGKDILKFHGIYWPAFLIAAGLDPPKMLLCHSHWTVNHEKMSKSKDNVISPLDMLEKYGANGFRYFLLREGTPQSDANFSDIKVTNILNSELADTLGNLLNRCCSKSVNPKQVFPSFSLNSYKKYIENDATRLIDGVSKLPGSVEQHFSGFNFYMGVDAIIEVLHEANKFFEFQKPWQLAKSIDTSSHLEIVLHITMETLRVCGILLQPIIPDISDVILTKLNVSKSERLWKNIRPFSWETQVKHQAYSLSVTNEPLYKRIMKK